MPFFYPWLNGGSQAEAETSEHFLHGWVVETPRVRSVRINKDDLVEKGQSAEDRD